MEYRSNAVKEYITPALQHSITPNWIVHQDIFN